MVRDFYEALNDGMVAHRVRAWVYCLATGLIAGLVVCTWPFRLIPFSAWVDVPVLMGSMALDWLLAGGFWPAMLKLGVLAVILGACAVLASIAGDGSVRQ